MKFEINADIFIKIFTICSFLFLRILFVFTIFYHIY